MKTPIPEELRGLPNQEIKRRMRPGSPFAAGRHATQRQMARDSVVRRGIKLGWRHAPLEPKDKYYRNPSPINEPRQLRVLHGGYFGPRIKAEDRPWERVFVPKKAAVR